MAQAVRIDSGGVLVAAFRANVAKAQRLSPFRV